MERQWNIGHRAHSKILSGTTSIRPLYYNFRCTANLRYFYTVQLCKQVQKFSIYSNVLEVAVGDQLTFIIQVSGIVKYQEKPPKSFQQNFVITAQGDKWKIVSDCFRLQEPLSNTGNL